MTKLSSFTRIAMFYFFLFISIPLGICDEQKNLSDITKQSVGRQINNTFKAFTQVSPSTEGLFRINVSRSFANMPFSKKKSEIHHEKKELTRRDFRTRIAPDINLSDYCGFEINNNTTWEQFSCTTQEYEPQRFFNVKKEGDKYKSFDLISARGSWSIREQISNITYNTDGLPSTIELKSYDIAHNTSTQILSNIGYDTNPGYEEYKKLKELCSLFLQKGNYYGWDKILDALDKRTPQARYVPVYFDMKCIDSKKNITTLSFSNVKWNKQGIIGFNAVIKQPKIKSARISLNSLFSKKGKWKGVRITVSTKKGHSTISWRQDRISLAAMMKELLGLFVNPPDILGSSQIQIGNTKLAFLATHYDGSGYLTNPAKQHKITYNITDKENLLNLFKLDIFQLEQTAKTYTRNIVWNKNISTMKKSDLMLLRDIIRKQIEKRLARYAYLTKIETAWGYELNVKGNLRLELKNNRIISENVLLTTTRNTMENTTFIINAFDVLKAVRGIKRNKNNTLETLGKKYFDPPETLQEKQKTITLAMKKQMSRNQRNGLGYRTNTDIEDQLEYEIAVAERISKTGDIVFCFSDKKNTHGIIEAQIKGVGDRKEPLWKQELFLYELLNKTSIKKIKDMIPVHVKIIQNIEGDDLYTVDTTKKGLKKVKLKDLSEYYRDIEIVRHKTWGMNEKQINRLINSRIYHPITGKLFPMRSNKGKLYGFGDEKNRKKTKISSELVHNIGEQLANIKSKAYGTHLLSFGTVVNDNLVSPWDLFTERSKWGENIRDIMKREIPYQ